MIAETGHCPSLYSIRCPQVFFFVTTEVTDQQVPDGLFSSLAMRILAMHHLHVQKKTAAKQKQERNHVVADRLWQRVWSPGQVRPFSRSAGHLERLFFFPATHPKKNLFFFKENKNNEDAELGVVRICEQYKSDGRSSSTTTHLLDRRRKLPPHSIASCTSSW